MYCKHCGARYENESAVVCVKCGIPKGEGEIYCWNCGNLTTAGIDVCLDCGVYLTPQKTTNITSYRQGEAIASNQKLKSKTVVVLLGLFFGGVGFHDFYLGEPVKACIHLALSIFGVTFFGVGPGASYIWALVEIALILMGKVTVDGNGNPFR